MPRSAVIFCRQTLSVPSFCRHNISMARKTTRRTGQGTVYHRKDGRWEAAITHGYNENGNPKRYRVIRATRDEAVKALNDIITNLNLGVPVEMPKQTVEEYLAFWLKEHITPHRAPKTTRFYEQMIRLHINPKVGRLQLSKLSAQHIQSLLNAVQDAGLTPRTVQAVRATLRSALTTAWKWSLIRENPATRVNVPRVVKSAPVYLTFEECGALADAAAGHYLENLIILALGTGLRLGEATGLTWDRIDFDRETLRVDQQLQRVASKFTLRDLKSSSSHRTLPLNEQALSALQAQRALQMMMKVKDGEEFNRMGLVFTTPDGLPLDPKTVDSNLKKFATAAGVKKVVGFHKLRHTVATHMAATGVPLTVVKDQLGHSQISLTANTYSHAVPSALREASNALGRLMADRGKSDSEA